MILKAKVTKGRGLGANLVEAQQKALQELYPKSNDTIARALFPGTLNVVLTEPYRIIKAYSYDKKKKSFALPIQFNGMDCLLTFSKSFPFHIYEVIATVNLRKTLGLQDDDVVTLSIHDSHIKAIHGWRRIIWEVLYKGREDIYYDVDNFPTLQNNFLFKKLHRLITNKKTKDQSS